MCLNVLKFLAPSVCAVVLGAATVAQANIIVSEVAPWSSGNAPTLGVDWFELTNTGAAAIDITGWAVDDDSNTFANARALTGVTSIAPGESAIFMETADLPGKTADFKALWFGGAGPAGLQFGSYSGSGIGLGTGGDHLHLFNGAGVKQTSVSFGTSPGVAPYTTFDNKFGVGGTGFPPPQILFFSAAGVRGAFAAASDPDQIGSPGVYVQVPEPTASLLIALGMVSVLGVRNRFRASMR